MATSKQKRKYAIKFTQPTLAQQHQKDEVDINNIMERYVKTGVLDHVAKHSPQYTENTSTDYHESMNIVLRANEMFSELPSSVRKTFDNDPAKFLDYVQNPENQEKLNEMGLTENQKSPTGDKTAPPPPVAKPAEVNTPATEPATAAPAT